jgi:hypothetical protein
METNVSMTPGGGGRGALLSLHQANPERLGP